MTDAPSTLGPAAAQLSQAAERLLSPGEALLLLIVLTGAVFLGFSSVLAAWTLTYRGRKLDRERTLQDRAGRWKYQLREVLYGSSAPEALWSSVEEEDRIDFLNFLVEYVRRLEGEERETIRELARPYLSEIVEYLHEPVEGRRVRAVQTLGELGLPDFAEPVIAALDDESDDVAMVAASTLAAAEDGKYAPAVLARLHRFNHWRQDFLVAMLASMGPQAAPALRTVLSDASRTAKERTVAADALSQLGDPAAADLAHDVLQASADVDLRAATLRLLASVGRGEHVDAVRDAVADAALPVRLHAVRALGALGEGPDLALLDRTARDDASPWVAIAAARALKEAGGSGQLELLAGSEHPRAALGLQVISEVRSW
ncbi:MAG: HEAT repeat domain-containing protein [Longimicrobiales bacterium]|nr:HEAT repeat domain-containing protein [Longimicrobiales bacterium]